MKLKLFLALITLAATVSAWGNGFSAQNQPIFANSANMWSRMSMYGTHDYLAQYALSFLPPEERAWVQNNTYFYGTELPDSVGFDESIGDRNAQYVVFDSSGRVVNDSLAQRAMKKYPTLINSLSTHANVTASKWAGAVAAYVSDAGLFSRVISSQNGLKFEGYIEQMTSITYPSKTFQDKFGSYIRFDGQLEMISPYDAIMRVSQATYLGNKDGSCSAQWMESNYYVDSPEFTACAGRDFNNIVNAIADVLHTAYQVGVKGQTYNEYAHDWTKAPAQMETPVTSPIAPPVAAPPAVTPYAGNESSKPTQTLPEASGNTSAGLPQAQPAAANGSMTILVVVLIAVLVAIAIFIERSKIPAVRPRKISAAQKKSKQKSKPSKPQASDSTRKQVIEQMLKESLKESAPREDKPK